MKFKEPESAWAGWMEAGQARPLFLVGKAFDGNAAEPGNGQMMALLAKNREQVRQCYETALKSGAICDGAPGLRHHYHEHYYGAYFRDLDGNKICVCCHNSE